MALNVEEMAVRLWGPVEEERALQLGALAASSSVLMKPLATDDTVIERVHALVPHQEVLPTATDSKASVKECDSVMGVRLWTSGSVGQ